MSRLDGAPAARIERIDVHSHAFPEEYLRAIARTYPDDARIGHSKSGLVVFWSQVPLRAWEPETRLEEMGRDSVVQEILSAPTVYRWLDRHTVGFCRDLNDFQADLSIRHPGRFRSFLHLPVHDPASAQRELERWQGDPVVAGVVIGSNMGGRYPGDAEFLPIWAMVDELDLAVFVHPLQPASPARPINPAIVLFPCDTTLAAASLIYGGVMERFPRLRVILSHYGGALPMLARRLDMGVEMAEFPSGHGQDLSKPPSAYVSRFYADTAQGFHEPAFRCACATFGLDHILYGSDRFLEDSTWRQQLNDFFDGLDLSESDAEAVFTSNADRILAAGGSRAS